MENERLVVRSSRNRRTIDAVTWILRVGVGIVFIFSGFVKAVDPWGTLYKVDAYLSALSLDIWPNLELAGVFALCAAEFVVGVLLTAGCLRRSIAVVTLLLMAIMLPLSLWIAISDPVDDCGCFGDALVISNWATFWKNVFLTLAVVWLVIYNRRCHWLITPALQWIAILLSSIFILVIEIYGYGSQPLIDFRHYRQGESIIDQEETDSSDTAFKFIYEKEGRREEFSADDELPDESEGWVFVDRKEIPVSGNVSDNVEGHKNLRIYDREGSEDLTEEAIDNESKELLVMIPDLAQVSPATTWKLNSLYEWSVKHNVRMVGIVSGSLSDIEEWEDLSMASYPIYTADDTQIKEVVRGNPGIVYLEAGKIIWKSTLSAISIDDFLSPDTAGSAREFGVDNAGILRHCTSLYVIGMLILVCLSFAPSLRHIIHGGKARRAESSSPDMPAQ